MHINLKSASRVVFALYLMSILFFFGTVLYAGHTTRSIAFTVFAAISCIYLMLKFITARKKAQVAATPQLSGIQKISYAIIFSAAFGTIVAAMLLIWHVRYIGMPLTNISLVVCILGFILLMLAPQKGGPTVLQPVLSVIFRALICLCTIGTLTGLLLIIHHYPFGKQLAFGSMTVMFALLISVIIMGYMKKKTVR